MRTDVVERVRIIYGVEWPLCYASVLDQGRLWARLLGRAGIPVAFTQGYNPHPRLTFASALPVGYTSECEMLDVLLADEMVPDALVRAARTEAPDGLCLLSAETVALSEPSPQSKMREAEYTVTLGGTFAPGQVQEALDHLLARESIVRERKRKGRVRQYDLRRLVRDLTILSEREGETDIEMRVACGPNGSGRPEKIAEELNLEIGHCAIRRTRLVWQDSQSDAQEKAS